ncbi:MAG: hypothetical protein ACLQFR_00525 [Streptosporangiaceae bacterium]
MAPPAEPPGPEAPTATPEPLEVTTEWVRLGFCPCTVAVPGCCVTPVLLVAPPVEPAGEEAAACTK